MVKVLLIDDEFLVCSFLRNIIVWEDYGYTIVGQAANGNQALEKIRELKPDLIFLDVSMPDMDGINLIRILHAKYPEIKVIILSSYSDYEYVRETMKMGALDYLLKHQLNAEDLVRLLSGLSFDGKETGETSRPVPEDSNPSFDLLRDGPTRGFFEKRQHSIPAALEQLQKPMMAVAKIKISVMESSDRDTLEKQDVFIQALLSTCVQICNQEYKSKIVYMGDFTIIFLFSAQSREPADEQETQVNRCMNIIHDAALKYHNTFIDWKCGRRCESLEELPKEYFSLLESVNGGTGVKKFEKSCGITIEQERQIILSVLGKDKTGVHQVLSDIYLPLMNHKVHETEMALLSGDMLTLAVKLSKENHITFLPNAEHDILNTDVEKTYLYFNDLFLSLIDEINNTSKYTKTVGSIISYVGRHFREDIGLSSISESCSMNSSYISSVFKKETGMNLVLYINRMRIYYAGKCMIMRGVPPMQVCEDAGFHNYNNFFNLFKQITGMSPTQFKKQATVEWISKFDPLGK